LTVNRALATVVVGPLTCTYDGAAHGASVTTDPAGLRVTITYNGASAPPVAAGTYAVVATMADPDYTGSGSGTLVITKAPAVVKLAGLAQPYDGTPRAATVTTVPSGLSVGLSYNGNASAPTNPGTYAVVATINDVNYTGTASDTLTVGITALVRHAPALSGGLDGSVQLVSGENVSLAARPGLPATCSCRARPRSN